MENKSGIYNKVIIALLMFFIAGIVVTNFVLSDSKFIITVEVIICLALLTILALAELFDNLSIPKVISLSKNVREMEKENRNLKETNIKLLEQITTIKNSNNQNIYLPNYFSTISSSNINDINKNDEDEIIDDSIEKISSDDQEKYKKMLEERHKYKRVIEIFILKKALRDFENNAKDNNIQYDVKLINNKISNDRIMKNEARFDAFCSNKISNKFFEVKISPFVLDYSFELHYMLRTLELYQESNNIPTQLILLLPKMDEALEKILYNSSRDRFGIVKTRIEKRFEPAIQNNLLEILEVEVTKKELDEYMKK